MLYKYYEDDDCEEVGLFEEIIVRIIWWIEDKFDLSIISEGIEYYD